MNVRDALLRIEGFFLGVACLGGLMMVIAIMSGAALDTQIARPIVITLVASMFSLIFIRAAARAQVPNG